MKDTILKHIELNESYHNTKERMAWVASTLYFGFSVLLIKWLLSGKAVLNQNIPVVVVGLTIIYICALCFVLFQFEHRWDSVYKTKALLNVLRKSDGRMYSEFPEILEDEMEVEKKKKCNKRSYLLIILLTFVFPIYFIIYLISKVFKGSKCIVDSRYHTEIPTYTILTYFYAVQLYFLIHC